MSNRVRDCWMENSLVREFERSENFEGIGALISEASWFLPRWRNVIRKWYSEVARAFNLTPIASENALFFFDFSMANQLDKTPMLLEEVQLTGLVALLVACKMFASHPLFKIHDLLRLAPHLKVTPQKICDLELKLIQTLEFNLFVASTLEFSLDLLRRLVAQAGNTGGFSEEGMLGSIMKYIGYLESDFANIEYRQSEKARAVVHCALAKWSISKQQILTSKEMEEELISNALINMDKTCDTYGVGFSSEVSQVHAEWFSILESFPRLSQDADHERRVRLEELIVTAIGNDEKTAYALPLVRTSSEDILPKLKVVHSVPINSCHVFTPSTAITSKAATFTTVSETEATSQNMSSSPVDVMNVDEHTPSSLPSSKRLDLESNYADQKRQKTAH